MIARGVGTNFNGAYQFYVGSADDFVTGTPPADTTPPAVVGAWSPGATSVVVTFGEAVQAASGQTPGNYVIHETDAPGNTVAVSSVVVAGPVATLALGASLGVQTDYTLEVNGVEDLAGNALSSPVVIEFRSGGTVDTSAPDLTAAAAPTAMSITATFSEAIAAASGGNAANYAVFETANMSNTVPVSSVSVSGATATLTLGTALTGGVGYTLRASGIADLAGNVMPAEQTRTFTAPGGGGSCTGAVTIASIQANPVDGQPVTVQGQVYIRSDYRGSPISGYIQDGSGRGINVFGDAANDPRLQDVGNIVCITGTVDIFFTTIEISNLTTIALISSGNPPLQPTVLSTGDAANTQWEGTFIQVTGPITSIQDQATATNYTVDDGSGAIVVRVVDAVGASGFTKGQRITARGAGGQFQTDFQVLVGDASGIFEDTGGGDTTPPSITNATAPTASQVTVTFSEAVTTASGNNTANYAVFETANTSATVAVTAAALAGDRRSVNLTLGGTLVDARSYTVRVINLQDDAGNTAVTPLTRVFERGGGPVITPIATIQANPSAFDGMTVTVEGQVYIPSNYRGTTTSGYIQDSSGRGINIFGTGANVAAAQNTGNIIRVTGQVELFFTTVEVSNITNVTLVSSGNPPLQPTVLSTGAAASSQWEGTFIEVTGEISSIEMQTAARNYTIDDGSGQVVVRVVSTVAAPVFIVGQTITARGAGSQFQTTFQVLVGRSADVFEDDGGTDTTPPSITNATAPTASQVTVTFSEAVTTATGNNTANYAVFETANQSATIPVTAAALAGDRRSVNLTLGGTLVDARSYTVRASNLQDDAGNTAVTPLTRAFTRGGGPVITPIATIQANPSAFDGMTVTVEGQVYIPSNYRGTTTSGYIQDSSGRGINIFGTGANVAAAQNTGNIIRVTGDVELFFTTVEITNITSLTLVSSGNPPLQPTVLSTGDAANSQWEGTYVLVTGEILAIEVQTAARNYTINDDSGPVVVRVVSTVPAPVFTVGQTITARGAGSQFQTTFQILVGEASAIFEGEPTDSFPPSVLRASATGAQEVTVTFNEPVAQASAETSSNYEVFRTNNASEVIAVTSATLSGTSAVRLALASPINVASGYSVRVRNVADLLGNPISAAGVTRVIDEPLAESVAVSGPPFTFLPRRGETYPITFSVPSQFVSGAGEVLVRIFDLQGRLKKTLFDSRFEQNAFSNNRATRSWDGRDDVAEIVPAGTYVVHIVVVGAQSGERREAHMPVVVATRLDR